MARKQSGPSTERRDAIDVRLEEQRRSIERLQVELEALKKDVKERRDELKMRGAVILGLLGEKNLPDQICQECGVIRELLEKPWPVDTVCPDCTPPTAKAAS